MSVPPPNGGGRHHPRLVPFWFNFALIDTNQQFIATNSTTGDGIAIRAAGKDAGS
jgi:hypothetical protein